MGAVVNLQGFSYKKIPLLFVTILTVSTNSKLLWILLLSDIFILAALDISVNGVLSLCQYFQTRFLVSKDFSFLPALVSFFVLEKESARSGCFMMAWRPSIWSGLSWIPSSMIVEHILLTALLFRFLVFGDNGVSGEVFTVVSKVPIF